MGERSRALIEGGPEENRDERALHVGPYSPGTRVGPEQTPRVPLKSGHQWGLCGLMHSIGKGCAKLTQIRESRTSGCGLRQTGTGRDQRVYFKREMLASGRGRHALFAIS